MWIRVGGWGGTVKQQVDITLDKNIFFLKDLNFAERAKKAAIFAPKRATIYLDGLEIKFYPILTF